MNSSAPSSLDLVLIGGGRGDEQRHNGEGEKKAEVEHRIYYYWRNARRCGGGRDRDRRGIGWMESTSEDVCLRPRTMFPLFRLIN